MIEPACERCGGDGWIVTNRGAAPCECSMLKRIADSLAEIPHRYRPAVREGWLGPWPLPSELDEWRALPGASPWTILVLGPKGCGKTFAASALFRATVERQRIRGRFVDWPDTIEAVKREFDDEAAHGKTERRLLAPDLLLLDDLGAERPTEFALALAARVLRHRHAQALPTIITSNAHDLSAFEAIDPRVASRLAEDSVVLRMTGRDRRLEKASR